MQKVIITGAEGQLGKSLQRLAAAVEDINFVFLERQQLDITNAALVAQYVQQQKPDLIVNTAAYTQVDRAEEERREAHEVNVLGVANLLNACAQFQVKLIHISTDYVFDGRKSFPYEEEDVCSPVNYYGQTKYEAEKLIAEAKIQSVILRTSWLYSEYGTNFVKTMLRLLKERKSINVVNDQWGSPTYAKDLGLAILSLVENFPKEHEIYHFTNEGICTWFDFAKAIMQIAQIDCEVKPIETKNYPTPAKRPAYSVLCKTKMKSDFDYTIPHWRDSLEEMLGEVSSRK